MVRFCAVPCCRNADTSTLSHRFPKKKNIAKIWQTSLKLTDSIEILQTKFVVCAKHFKRTDYRNPESHHLNTTSVPTLDLEDDENINSPPDKNITSKIEHFAKNVDLKTLKKQNILIEPENEKEFLDVTGDDNKEVDASYEQETDVDIIELIDDEDIENESYELIDIRIDETSTKINENQPAAKKVKLNEPEDTFEYETSEPEYIEEEEERQTEDKEILVLDEKLTIQCAVQTDPVKFVSETDKIEDETILKHHPEYSTISKLNLITILMEKDKKIEELKKKLENFEEANSNMLKSMEAVKKLMNFNL